MHTQHLCKPMTCMQFAEIFRVDGCTQANTIIINTTVLMNAHRLKSSPALKSTLVLGGCVYREHSHDSRYYTHGGHGYEIRPFLLPSPYSDVLNWPS